VSDHQQVNEAWDTILKQMNLTEDQAVQVMDSAVLINYVARIWLESLEQESADVPAESSEVERQGEEIEEGKAVDTEEGRYSPIPFFVESKTVDTEEGRYSPIPFFVESKTVDTEEGRYSPIPFFVESNDQAESAVDVCLPPASGLDETTAL
jgi:antitoxin component of MazEF toxin-antitoxin module